MCILFWKEVQSGWLICQDFVVEWREALYILIINTKLLLQLQEILMALWVCRWVIYTICIVMLWQWRIRLQLVHSAVKLISIYGDCLILIEMNNKWDWNNYFFNSKVMCWNKYIASYKIIWMQYKSIWKSQVSSLKIMLNKLSYFEINYFWYAQSI